MIPIGTTSLQLKQSLKNLAQWSELMLYNSLQFFERLFKLFNSLQVFERLFKL